MTDATTSGVASVSRGIVGFVDVKASQPNQTTGDTCIAVDGSKRLPCDVCGHPMEPEHAHYRCPACHYILPCCGW